MSYLDRVSTIDQEMISIRIGENLYEIDKNLVDRGTAILFISNMLGTIIPQEGFRSTSNDIAASYGVNTFQDVSLTDLRNSRLYSGKRLACYTLVGRVMKS